MNTSKPFLYCALGAAALFFGLAWPAATRGQAQSGEPPLLSALLAELTAQQTVLLENQAKIDQKIAVIAEDVRLARIFASRGGGKK